MCVCVRCSQRKAQLIEMHLKPVEQVLLSVNAELAKGEWRVFADATESI